jgi:transmembrane sensor
VQRQGGQKALKNNVIKFQDPRKAHEEIREQACVWLARIDKGASSEDMEQLIAWMERDPLHARMLLNMAAMWDQTAILTELSEIFPLDDNSVSLRTRRRNKQSIAFAVFATFALFGGAFLGLRNLDVWDSSYILDEVYETAVGERRQVNLPDGSVVTLNTNTKIQFSFNRNERTVFLEHGEGFFTVAKDVDRPFRVYAGSRVVEAIGTAFTVQHTTGKDIEVMVTEGKVNFLELAAPAAGAPPASAQAPRQTIEQKAVVDNVIPLSAGEQITIAQELQEIERDQLQPDEVEVKLAWRVGMLVFQGDSLETVLQEVSRYTTMKLEAEESIRNIQIDGLFPAGDIDRLLIAMERNFNVTSQRIGEDQILFTARAEEK